MHVHVFTLFETCFKVIHTFWVVFLNHLQKCKSFLKLFWYGFNLKITEK